VKTGGRIHNITGKNAKREAIISDLTFAGAGVRVHGVSYRTPVGRLSRRGTRRTFARVAAFSVDTTLLFRAPTTLLTLIDVCSIVDIHTYIHPLNGPLSGTTQVSRYQKGKTNLDFTGARDSEWQWHQRGHS